MRAVHAAAGPAPIAWRSSWLVWCAASLVEACQPGTPQTDWTCDFDASETRPLADGDAAIGPDGALPQGVCEDTCGTPAKRCTFAVLDGGVHGAACPVCTF